MLSKFLSPKNDFAFKKIFGTPKNQDILIHFLNDMLVFKENKPITKVTFLKTVQDPEIASKKTSIVDIMCADEFGNSYIVEMQIADGDDFIKRAQYYAAKAYCSQLNIGEKYYTLKEIIFLAITNFVMFPDKQEYKSDHVILDKLTNEHNLKDFSFTFLELAKFNKTKEELSNIIDKWAYFFKHANETSEQDLKFITGNDLIIERAFEELNQFSWSSEELLTYEAVIKRDRDHVAIMDKQNRLAKAAGMEEGIELGIRKGVRQGIRKGIRKGIEKGIEKGEQTKSKAIAIAMLKEGLDISLISKMTNLSIKDIKNIKELEYV